MTQIKINLQYEIILALLKEDAHGRELAKKLNVSLTSTQRSLKELASCNVSDYKKQGKNNIYFIKKNMTARAYVLNAENYKKIKLISKYPFFEPLFKEINKKYPDLPIILFGSYAKFAPRDESDIDIYAQTRSKKIKKDIESVHNKIKIKIGNFNKSDLLIKEIIKNHIIIQGAEKYYEELEFFK